LRRKHRVVLIDLTGLTGAPEEPAPGPYLAAELARRGYSVRLAGHPANHASRDETAVCLTHDACLKPEQRAAHRAARAVWPGLISVATGLPYDLAWLLKAPSGLGLCTYDPGPASIEVCAAVLSGEIEPRGRLPVQLAGACTEE